MTPAPSAGRAGGAPASTRVEWVGNAGHDRAAFHVKQVLDIARRVRIAIQPRAATTAPRRAKTSARRAPSGSVANCDQSRP